MMFFSCCCFKTADEDDGEEADCEEDVVADESCAMAGWLAGTKFDKEVEDCRRAPLLAAAGVVDVIPPWRWKCCC